MKRFFDILFSLIGIVIFIPFFILIPLLILLDNYGPVFFSQYRVGQNGKLFKLIKFRSMNVLKTAQNGTFDVGNISRVTEVGKLLRKSKIDELPQLLNVLKGDMSIVGPRPEVKRWVEMYPERWQFVHQVKPGITDYASIEFRNEEEILARSLNPEETYRIEILPRKLDLCERYVREQSFINDINIIFKTIYCVVKK